MIKTISLLLLLSVTLFAKTNFSPFHTTVSQVHKNSISVASSAAVAIGSTGVIIQSFTADHKTIIASVEVIKKEAGKMILALSPFNAIAQEALPNYSITPKVGDEVILNFLYNKALAIVPNADTYKIVTQSYEDFTWTHPDILAASLSINYTPEPSKETFKEACTQHNIGLLLIAVNGKGHFVDCQSFKILQTIPLPIASSIQTPFYSRLETIKGRVFGLVGGKGIKNYNAFYSALLK